MASFDKAIPTILRHEGGYVHDPKDPGGETNFGISKRQYPDLNILHMSMGEAVEIYHADYWLSIYDAIGNQDVATKVFDLAVNMGPKAAHRLLQKALRKFKLIHRLDIKIDGIFGPRTLQALNGVVPWRLLTELRIQAAVYYVSLIARRPELIRFVYNWMRRAQS